MIKTGNKNIYKQMLLLALTVGITAGACGCSTSKQLENEDAYRQIGINALQNGDYADAVSAFQNALEQRIGKITNLEIDICYYKALAQYKNGDIADCIETYTALVEYDKKNADAYFLRGCVYLQQQSTAKALADFESAIKISPKDYELYLGIADALADSGETDSEQDFLEKASKIGGSDGESLRYQGMAAFRLGNTDSAVELLQKAIDAGDGTSRLELGKLYLQSGEQEEAATLFEAYLQENPQDTDALNQLGLLEAENEDYAAAIAYFEQGLAVENAANARELLKNEIAAYEQAADFDSAKTKMAEYLQLYPQDEEAIRENTFLETR